MKRFLAVLAVLSVAVIGVFIVRSGGPEQAVRDIAKVLPRLPSRTATSEQTAQRQETDNAGRFAFQRLNIDTGQELPQACLVFSKALDDTGQTRYEDYVRFESGRNPILSVKDSQLCLEGLSFAASYRVTLRQGMPSADGSRLAYAEDIPVELNDRPAMVQFGSGLILPRETAGGVPITTVNVDLLDIRVLRVGDRLLSQLESGLIDQRNLYSYDEYEIEFEKGALVWEGQMDVDAPRNRSAETVFRVRDAVTDWQPGAYLVLARDAAEEDQTSRRRSSYYNAVASQWIVDSDIGLTTFTGSDGLHVYARSLKSAQPLGSVTIKLIARNNDILGEGSVSGDGYIQFDAAALRGVGGAEPVAVMAYGPGGDFNFLDLRRPAFDLTDRGVSGRLSPGPIDAYLYTDRGIYRPGENVHVITMLRDRMVNALDDAPLTLSVRRPDGVEYRQFTTSEQKAGSSYFDIRLSDTAPRGRWRAVAMIGADGDPVGRVSFEVQDFVPQRLEVTLDAQAEFWRPGDALNIEAVSRFLYGAPAADLGGEAELKLMVDPNPFPAHAGYRFGRIKEIFRDSLTPMDIPNTDAQGETSITGVIPQLNKTTLPLRARVRVSVYEPGGRTTSNEIIRPVRTSDVMIGIRPGFEGGRVRENTAAAFEIIAVDADGARIGLANLSYRLVEEDIHYQWYEVNGRWQYERIVRDRPVEEDVIDVEGNAPAVISKTLPWGQYRLQVSDASSGAATSVRFNVGWGGALSGARPDRVQVTADKDSYSIGDVAVIDIRPPVSGKALLVVANDKVLLTRHFDVPEGGARIDVPVSEDWGSGAYVMVTTFKPLSSQQTRAPVRSIGLAWAAVDQSPRILSVNIETPDKVAPRQRIKAPLTISGAAPGARVFVTLAAVDQGILQLTKFKTPSPADYYFGKRRLGLDIRDDYARLILDTDGAPGALRVGGDAMGGAGLSVVPTVTVALFSGLVEVDADRRAVIELNLPDFVGELRLMAVAFSAGKVGMGERTLTVRDDVVAEMTLPRFLAPGDKSNATLSVHNVDGAPGEYVLNIKVTGSVGAGSMEPRILKRVTLAENQRRSLEVPVNGLEPGIGTITVAVDGPNTYHINRAWPIEVRPAQLPVTSEVVALLGPGEGFDLNAAQVAGFYADTASVAASVSVTRGPDVPGLLAWLDRYPYGCLEQTTSRAFPLLYYNELSLVSHQAEDKGIKFRVQNAVDRVLDMQNGSGSFGMWGPSSYDADTWLSVFALDFISQAKAQDYVVPQDSLERGLRWLRGLAGQSYRDLWARSYAFYILAREGSVNASDLRYFADNEMVDIENALSAAHLAAALVEIGDRSRARLAFNRALDLITVKEGESYEATPYGSQLRDAAGVMALAAASDETQILPALFDVSERLDRRIDYTTTQEKAWLLFAAYQMNRAGGALDVDIDGASAVSERDPVFLVPAFEELKSGVRVTNQGERDIWRTVTIAGVPKEPLAAAFSNVRLTKSFRTLKGAPMPLDQVKQNDRAVVLIRGQMNDEDYHEMIALDLLPAGWEIEAVLKRGDTAYEWLPALTNATMIEARDDRFVAAFDIGWRYERRRKKDEPVVYPKFTLAYVVRAVTPGEFILPAARVEDMYKPSVYARTEPATLTVTAR